MSGRDLVLTQAARMFFSEGIRAVRMDDIAHSLRMSKRTLYMYFRDKAQLLEECLLAEEAKQRRRVERLMEGEKDVLAVILRHYQQLLEGFARISPEFIDDIKHYPKILTRLEELHRQRDDDTQRFLLLGVEQGVFLPDLNVDILLRVINSIGEGVGRQRLFEHYPPTDVLLHSFLLYLRGLATQESVKRIDEFLATLMPVHGKGLPDAALSEGEPSF